MFRIYVERKSGFQNEASQIYSEIKDFLGVSGVSFVRYFNRYDIENVSDTVAKEAVTRIFSEPKSDFVFYDTLELPEGTTQIVWEYLPGQYDQRADSAEQCLSLLQEGMNSIRESDCEVPAVRCAKIVFLEGNVSKDDVLKIQRYLVNPVDSRLTDSSLPETLKIKACLPSDIAIVEGFISKSEAELEAYRKELGLAMDVADVKFMQDYFKSLNRNPTFTEIRVLDTYWSDHCRHTTFLTILDDVKIEEGPYSSLFKKSLENYRALRTDLYADRKDKPVTLMDMACIGAKYLRKHGKLDDLEVSAEINACSIFIDVHYTSGEPDEKWLLQFKNETHNHPTEIEPFGGAATCIGGAIRDPLSGRAWVYQALRVTGAADPTVPLSETLPGKLPQMKLTREAAQGFSSYGNQIGLTTGQVSEIYHPGYVAKRMELGAVIAAAPVSQVIREEPEVGDVVILLGGGTGRDGIGGATGSSKVHSVKSVSTAAAEVQKGNAVEERKIQRLFRNESVCRMIRRSNDFGAGGVSVAIGELAEGLEINLDAVPKKYEGLDGTELAISESQERMAVVVRKSDAEKFIAECNRENLNAVIVAFVTDTKKLVMKWRGKTIVDLDRSFLDSSGAEHHATAFIKSPSPKETSPLVKPLASVEKILSEGNESINLKKTWLCNIGDLACCSQRGLGERFDGSIGSSSVLFPYGGKYQATPEAGMVAKIPVVSPRETPTVSLMSFGFDPRISAWSAWHGAQTAVLSSLAKIVCMGGNAENCRLTFQEFFGRAVTDATWGYPAAALLGAIDAQLVMGTGSIGGKDSMSGTFEDMNVPNTLVSFAVCVDDVKNITSGSFKKAGSKVYLVRIPYSEELKPDFDVFKKNASIIYDLNKERKLLSMYPVSSGGIAEAISKMALGNRVGASIKDVISIKDFFVPIYGSIIIESETDLSSVEGFVSGTVTKIGETIKDSWIEINGNKILLSEIEKAWEAPLEKVFPSVSGSDLQPPLPPFALDVHPSILKVRKDFKESNKTSCAKNINPFEYQIGKAKPKVLIPVFPGTNCEYDIARAFNLSGGDTKTLVFRNRTQTDLSDSLNLLCSEIDSTQILAFAGGFSAGDEPDGSGKYIANVIRAPKIADSIMSLLKKRRGLILGICNGFQALIKTGLVPFGEIKEPSEDLPTLTFNKIGRHISRIVRTRVVSAISPWALNRTVIEPVIHLVPISHGEGRVIVSTSLAETLFKDGQVFSQYVDETGNPTIIEPDNPNGSLFAIEGLTSPDGHVLGKMGHNERTMGSEKDGLSSDLIKNIAGMSAGESSCQNIFTAGIEYFN